MSPEEINAFVDGLRKKAWEDYIPVMREETAKLLTKCVKDNKPTRILEIGTCIGTSGIIALNNSKARLTTIEIDEEVQNTAKNNFAKCGLTGRAEFLLGDCNEVVFMMDGNNYDMVILDGPKSHYLELFKTLLPMVNKNGIIFVDNIHIDRFVDKDGETKRKHRTIVKGMKDFLDYLSSGIAVNITRYDIEDGVLIIKKL